MNRKDGESHSASVSGSSGKADALIQSGMAHKKKGEYDEAIADYTAALEADPGNAEILYNRGVAYGMINEYESAIADYTSALRIIAARGTAGKGAAGQKKKSGGAYRPKTFEDDALFLLYNNRGFACYKSEQYGNAIKDYTETIKIDPKHDRAYSIRGAACLELGQFGDAVKDFSRVIRPNGYDYSTYFNRGLAYSGLGLFDAAIKDFSEAIRINPNCTEAHQELARAYSDKKQAETGGAAKGSAAKAQGKAVPAKVQDAPVSTQTKTPEEIQATVPMPAPEPPASAQVQDEAVKEAPEEIQAAAPMPAPEPAASIKTPEPTASAQVRDEAVKEAPAKIPSAAPMPAPEQAASIQTQNLPKSENARSVAADDDDDAWVPGSGSSQAEPAKLPEMLSTPPPAPVAPVKVAEEAPPVKEAVPEPPPAPAAPVKVAEEAPPVKEAVPEPQPAPAAKPVQEPLLTAVESIAEEAAAPLPGRPAPIPIAPIKLSTVDEAPEEEPGDTSAHETDAFPKAEINAAAAGDNVPEIEMVFVKGGAFSMGSDEFEDERPVHRVTVSDFHIGRYPVTRKQWETVMGASGSFVSAEWPSTPVTGINWLEAAAFIEKLNAMTGKKYRLPTEAEWEYAARGGERSMGYKYSGSNNIDDVAWYFDNSGAKNIGFDSLMRGYLEGNEFSVLHPVGSRLSNELGICDMSGSVYEWVSDWYGNYDSEPQTDPKGPSFGTARIRRGGAWGSFEDSCCVSRRSYDPPGVDIETAENRGDIPFLGFRLAM